MRKLLRVNLSKGVAKDEDIPKKLAIDYVGGRGIGSKYLYDEVPAGTDPLGKQNKLLIGTGLLAGTSAQSLSKWVASRKAPSQVPLSAATAAGISEPGLDGQGSNS